MIKLDSPQLYNRWLLFIGILIPISIAFLNTVILLGLLCLVFAYRKNMFFQRKYLFFILIPLFFFVQEAMQGQISSRFGSLLLLLFICIVIGQASKEPNNTLWHLNAGLLLGTFIGFAIEYVQNPHLSLWSTLGQGYPNEAAYISLVAFLLLFFIHSRWKYVLGFMLLFFIYMTESKSTFIGLGVAAIFYLLIRYQQKKAIAILISLPVLVGAAAIVYAASLSNQELTNLTVTIPRLDLWLHGVKIAESAHWLGIGEMQYSKDDFLHISEWLPSGHGYWHDTVLPLLHADNGYDRVPFHDLFVHALVEHGILGLIMLCITFLSPFLLYLYDKNPRKDKNYAIGMAIWGTFCVHCVFELGLYEPSAILLGLIAGMTNIFQLQSIQKV